MDSSLPNVNKHDEAFHLGGPGTVQVRDEPSQVLFIGQRLISPDIVYKSEMNRPMQLYIEYRSETN